jgi:hypothetical protein
MSTARCQEAAERCDRLAAIMIAPAQRDSYIELANLWRKLANDTEIHLQRVASWERRNGVKPLVTTKNPFHRSSDSEPPGALS